MILIQSSPISLATVQMERSCRTYMVPIDVWFSPMRVVIPSMGCFKHLPPVILRRWHAQSDEKCDSTCPTTAHILGGCPVHSKDIHVLPWPGFTLLVSKLKEVLKDNKSIRVYDKLKGWWSSESPQAIIPTALVSIPFRPDIVVYTGIILLQPQLFSWN